MQSNSRQQSLRMILLGKDEVEMEVFKEEDEAAKPENDIIEENEKDAEPGRDVKARPSGIRRGHTC